jgi:2-polyprenyl-3-methyl-5-hydroxy-6-metoxy-1,4-benzoquinol methylase
MSAVDARQLRAKVKEMYKSVAEQPQGTFHFEMGRELAQRLGYPAAQLDRLPVQAIESFAGVGYHLGLATLAPGERVLDMGSGSGTDAFLAWLGVSSGGQVIGIDMTDEQLAKARRLAADAGFAGVGFEKAYIEEVPVETGSVDVVISNGVINLCADKQAVLTEIARVLKPGGRMAISDIVTEKQLTEAIICDVNLWASCIGGAMQQDDYQNGIEDAGLKVSQLQENPQYGFISSSAQGATKTFGVKSVSILAVKP